MSDLSLPSRPQEISARISAVTNTYQQNTSITCANTQSELTQIFRFRYKIYIKEMNLTQFHADHCKETIEDPLDRGADNFAALQDGKIVGVLRLNRSSRSDLSYYDDFLGMASVGASQHPAATSICTRLMVEPRLRGSTVALRLCQAVYSFALGNGIKFNFLDCNDHMIRFFEKLGYCRQNRAIHPEYGVGTVMRLDLLDRMQLARTRSPFLPILDWAKPLLAGQHGMV
jgi:GNAT superfamily N-acetyltransferase